MQDEELLTIKQIANLTGKSSNTIRSWIKRNKIKAYKEGDKQNSPVKLKYGDLIGLMRELGIIENNLPFEKITPTNAPGKVPGDGPTDLPEQQFTKEINLLVAELKHDKDRLLKDIEYYREDIRRLREELNEARQHGQALERELHSVGSHGKGILGYLSSKIKGSI